MDRLKNITIIFLSAVLIFSDSAFSAHPNTSIVGNWMSKPGQFKIVFRVSKNEDGTLIAHTDIPDQEAWDMPTDFISSDGPNVKFDMYNIRCIYEGKISGNGRSIDGKFRGPDGGGMPLTLERVKKPPIRTSKRPQEPKKPYQYKEETGKSYLYNGGITLNYIRWIYQKNSEILNKIIKEIFPIM